MKALTLIASVIADVYTLVFVELKNDFIRAFKLIAGLNFDFWLIFMLVREEIELK